MKNCGLVILILVLAFPIVSMGQSTYLPEGSKEYQTPAAIASRLHLPIDKVKETLIFLESNQMVKRHGTSWRYEQGSVHVRKDSPFQTAMQSTRRELAARSSALNSEDALHFSSLFTIDEKDFELIKEILSGAIERSQRTVHSSGTDRLACICVDVFEVV